MMLESSCGRLGGVPQPSVTVAGEEIEKCLYSADVRIKCGKYHARGPWHF